MIFATWLVKRAFNNDNLLEEQENSEWKLKVKQDIEIVKT